MLLKDLEQTGKVDPELGNKKSDWTLTQNYEMENKPPRLSIVLMA